MDLRGLWFREVNLVETGGRGLEEKGAGWKTEKTMGRLEKDSEICTFLNIFLDLLTCW